MAYSQQQIDDTFDEILREIEQGNSLISILRRKEFPSTATFYQWLEADEDKAKRYVRACEIRADVIFEDIIDIADMPVIGKHVSAAGVAAWLADMAHNGTLVVVLEDVSSSPQMGVLPHLALKAP